MRNGCIIIFFILALTTARAQRSYTTTSVLATGNWYKITIHESGIYKVDMALLSKLGMNTANLPSAAIRLFGNGGAMLPEACNGAKTDDLVENAIEVIDGGDGIFNGNDYFLFFASGPDTWTKDSANRRFKHQKNLYGNQSSYYITTGGSGKRIQVQNNPSTPNTSVNSFSERWFHELDSVNLLSSSKDWYGEELSAAQGNSRSFAITIPDMVNQPATFVSSCIARSVAGSSRFAASINGQAVLQQNIAAVGGGNLNPFAKSALSSVGFTPGTALSVTYNFTPGSNGALGWIDWFEIFCRRNLVLPGIGQLLFRDWNSVAAGNTASFNIRQAAAAAVWDVTNPAAPVKMATVVNGNDANFTNDAATLHEYIALS